ncbi:MAG: hypothetical protein KJ799_14205 [Bacteroidetes bacterium]|nr:hypothetical protein [Bacteroidota bacterium]MBU1679035.1 hypothetical protein [Bacteroidota bacterium]MBU2507858.1 hypothetical protein [Bacteroidota bacterium]
MKEENNLNRRKFFTRIGISAFGVALLSNMPFNFLKSDSRFDKKIKLKIHPSAVQRKK